MKKLFQLSLVALAGQLAFSCSPTKEYYQFAAKDSAYGFKAPKKEVVQAETASPAIVANEVQEEALVTEPIVEANAGADMASAAAYTAPVYAAPVAATKTVNSKRAPTPNADVSTTAGKADTGTKAVMATKKDLKKKIKDITKTERLTGNLRLALLLLLVAIVATALTGIAGLGTLMGIIAAIAGIGAAVFFVFWILDEL